MIDNCPEVRTQEAILLAGIYYQEGKRIIDQSAKVGTDIYQMICRSIVGYTNLAFACEVALKALVVCHNGAVERAPRGHSLIQLFEQLRSDVQTAVSYVTVEKCKQKLINQDYTHEMFKHDLDKYSHTFEEARYWYERIESAPAKEAGILFISSFAEALLTILPSPNDYEIDVTNSENYP